MRMFFVSFFLGVLCFSVAAEAADNLPMGDPQETRYRKLLERWYEKPAVPDPVITSAVGKPCPYHKGMKDQNKARNQDKKPAKKDAAAGVKTEKDKKKQ